MTGSAFDLADTTYTVFFSLKDSGAWIWGVGPAIILAVATEDWYASDKWPVGPAFVALMMATVTGWPKHAPGWNQKMNVLVQAAVIPPS